MIILVVFTHCGVYKALHLVRKTDHSPVVFTLILTTEHGNFVYTLLIEFHIGNTFSD